AQVSSDHERYPADVKCLGFLYLYVGRYPRNNASRNIVLENTLTTDNVTYLDITNVRFDASLKFRH
ncbi:MAG: hypothetical protein BECKG1743F_GA0114225_106384, partial [Candidatus Kentron sp. G]